MSYSSLTGVSKSASAKHKRARGAGRRGAFMVVERGNVKSTVRGGGSPVARPARGRRQA